MENDTPKKRIKNGYEYYAKCDICGKEINGLTIKQVVWNLAVHKESHKKGVEK